ncbi:hypothetical protein [Allosalinactinospora lopnorensis]|uniref:hypothetical protein n=1 Tax=Allosalinactinospora lopnorensis TaxID=1352348 RepID=UPI0012E1B673|nr:hypothetical protein [Allosalinactinospora lopnorensis]
MLPSGVPSWAARAVLAAVATVAVAAAAVAAGLVWGKDGPAREAAPGDTYAAAPGCATVPAEAVESAVPGAALDASERGPLHNADGATCVWTSVDSGGAAPRALHVDFTANFTDKAGEVSGTASAAERIGQLGSVDELDGASPVPSLGTDATVREGTPGGGTAEVAFRRHNLVVRVLYGGDKNSDGRAIPYEEARDGAVSVAEHLAEGL